MQAKQLLQGVKIYECQEIKLTTRRSTKHFIKNYIYPPKGKRAFGRVGRRLQWNIEMDIKEQEWEGLDRMHVAREREKG